MGRMDEQLKRGGVNCLGSRTAFTHLWIIAKGRYVIGSSDYAESVLSDFISSLHTLHSVTFLRRNTLLFPYRLSKLGPGLRLGRSMFMISR